MSGSWGRYFRITTFGESHGPAIGVVVDGLPPGLAVTTDTIQVELDRRRPGTSEFVTPRQEPDRVQVLSGVFDGHTVGAPVALVIANRDARSGDYAAFRNLFRPGHADFTYHRKYGLPPLPGGGRSSGRETAARVAAGALAKALLGPLGVTVRSAVAAVGPVRGVRVDWDFAEYHPLRCADPDRAAAMAETVRQAKDDRDSVGGMVEVAAFGVPAGWGDPVFDKLDAALAGGLMSIGGVKGVEVGAGFACADRRGSENNDQSDADGFLTNHAGGILGGISTGQPIVVRLAVKPTPSIGRPQTTVDIDGRTQTIETHGRHDPCLCPRICPVAEAMTALVLADAFLQHRAQIGASI
jgi:chorismate synthase